MYPHNFFNLFPPFPHENKVFVAMDFDKRFDNRWEKIIKQAVQSIKHKERSLEPYRVDNIKISDSILTDILIGISNCQLFFADLTTIGYLNKKDKKDKKAIRNGNVMYEVGIAQAVRLPEEVILFRSDNDSLPFDLVNIRVNHYDPDNKPDEAIYTVRTVIKSAFEEINRQKHLAVSRVAKSLDYYSFLLLKSANSQGIVKHPKIRNVISRGTISHYDNPIKREIIDSIPRLIELGILSTQYNQLTTSLVGKLEYGESEELLSYKITAFGTEVLKEVIIKISSKEGQKINDSSTLEELLKIINNLFPKPPPPINL